MSPCPASSPSTKISSSRASQCSQARLSATYVRYAGVASSKRANQASGTDSVRPSAITYMLSWSNRTALGEVFIPSPFDSVCVVCHHRRQFAQSARVVTLAASQLHGGLKPKFSFTLAATHMQWLKPTPVLSPQELRSLREKFALSRPVFASYLRTNPPYPRKLVARPRQTQCPSGTADSPSGAFSGYGGAFRVSVTV